MNVIRRHTRLLPVTDAAVAHPAPGAPSVHVAPVGQYWTRNVVSPHRLNVVVVVGSVGESSCWRR